MVPTYLVDLPDGTETWATLKIMAAETRKGKRNPLIRFTAAELVQQIPERNWFGEINTIFEFVRDNIRYTLDIDDTETIQQPQFTLQNGYGDCDDQCILLASLLCAVGHPCRFCAIGYTLNEYCHVFVETRGGGETRWISLDPTEQVPMGWRPPGPYAMKPLRINVAVG